MSPKTVVMESEVLFITHDGVEIKMGGHYWYFDSSIEKLRHVKVCSWQDYGPAKGVIQFGSEQAAIEYKKSYHADTSEICK
jgi:hypothetical protein